ncbi:MAG: hypothetical protein JJU03_08335 [Idiomarina sp.]|nr:hypothetical protein [Idiomarina sp.]
MQKSLRIAQFLTLIGFAAAISACTTTTMTDAERDARMAECQLINDDDERAECLERLALGDQVDPVPQNDPIQ